MLTTQQLYAQLPYAFSGVDLPSLGTKISGKVRDNYRFGDKRILITTDRLSAFDRILGLVPYKGQVLNQLAQFWFEESHDIIPNHLLDVPDPNVSVAIECRALPVEVVVRGYITGVTTTALWYQYSLGNRNIYGYDFPDGLNKNQALPHPIITPTTKATTDGGHDERITIAEVLERGLTTPEQWERISEAAIKLFRRGQAMAARGGLMLVDTKYEFGIAPDGEVTLIDEIHTPDSSRFWIADTYKERLAKGEEPENFDKEFVRLRYAADGYRGEGDPSPMPEELAVAAAERYIRAYEMITNKPFVPGEQPTAERIERNMAAYLGQSRPFGKVSPPL
jgi:phosphoribosylaminoimidazole-succinocarboxamide synthase